MIPGDTESVRNFVWRMFTETLSIEAPCQRRKVLPGVFTASKGGSWDCMVGAKLWREARGCCLDRRAWLGDKTWGVIDVEDEKGLECDTTIASGR